MLYLLDVLFNTPKGFIDFVTWFMGQATEDSPRLAGRLQGAPGAKEGQQFPTQTQEGVQEVSLSYIPMILS